MKRIKTYVVLAGLMAVGLTVQAEQNTPPADPAWTNPDLVSEQDDQVLDSQDSAATEATDDAATEAIEIETTETDPTETSKAEALWAALQEDEEATEAQDPVAAQVEGVEGESDSEIVQLAQVDTNLTDAAVVEETAEEASEDDTDTSSEETSVLGDSEQATVVIPLIVMDEVPLMDAIRNLARQAMINYMVDPRVPYGQVGEDGMVTPQPILSIRWENVTAEQALVAVLNNYNLQLVEDPKAKIFRVTVKDPAAPDPLVTKIIQLKYASPTNVVDAVQSTFVDARSKVVADTRTSQIVVVTTEKELVSIEEMVEQLDKPTRQVLIEGRIIETTANPKTVKGIDWTDTLSAQRFTFGNNVNGGQGGRYSQTTTITSNLLGGITVEQGFGPNNLLNAPRLLVDTASGFNPSTAFLDADGVSATLSFLNTHADSKEIATPRAVTLDNETARLKVVRAFPIFKNTAGTQGSPGGSEVTYTNLGITLDVTPRISANDSINLKVVPEVSSRFDTVERVVASTVNQADIYDVRRIDTRVLIPSGNTLVMGGLLRDRTRNSNTKVPLLGDLPVFGLLFRQDAKERDKINLMVFITPTIIQDSDFQPTPTDFLKNKFEEVDDTEWGAWDSGKKADWSLRKKKD